MQKWTLRLLLAGIVLALGNAALAGDIFSAPTTQPTGPMSLSTTGTNDEGIYTMPQPPGPGEGVNQGGVHFGLDLSYFNQYVYRGVDHSIGEAAPTGGVFNIKGSTLNLQVDSRLDFDLGKFPHPFLGLFTDVYDADPTNKFQEVRPSYGFDWQVKPLDFIFGGNTYIYPDRDHLDTAEFFGRLTLNDSLIFHSAHPIFTPYAYAAYDYDKNHGWYTEWGGTHDFPIDDLGLTLTLQADMAYIIGYQQQFVFLNEVHDTGFQHYDLGLKLDYSLNHLLNLGDRFGQFDVVGSFFYTGVIDGDLTANNVIWGGVGIGFKY